MEKTNMGLKEAKGYVDDIWESTRNIAPKEVEQQARVLLTRGDRGQAIKEVIELTGMETQNAEEYIEDLQPSIRIRIPKEVEQEISKLIIQSDMLKAGMRVREFDNRVGLHYAMEYVRALQVSMTIQIRQPAKRQLSAIEAQTPMADDIAPEVQAQIKKDYSSDDWDGVSSVLRLYGQEDYERERGRVHLGILKLAEGHIDKLLKMVEAAKQDYRDVLLWAKV